MIQIKEKIIGNNNPVFVIGECGINHNGDLNTAKQLVDVAVNAGADSVKFQTFRPNEIRDLKNITYDETIELKKYCDEKGIIFFSTPHTLDAIDFLAPIVPAYKIASPYLTHDYFIKRIKVKNKPIIASVGSMVHHEGIATTDEVDHFLSIMNQNTNLALLYCVSKYPCYNFSESDFLFFKEKYGAYPIGYSSHSKDISYSLCSVELGACIIEQHITLDNDFDCPDKNVSLSPNELKDLIEQIRLFEEEKQ
jgi:sialic acid synthase SpsE